MTSHDPFFIRKNKRKPTGGDQNPKKKRRQDPPKRARDDDDEVGAFFDDDKQEKGSRNADKEVEVEMDLAETADEKRVRLAKGYLQKLAAMEMEREEDSSKEDEDEGGEGDRIGDILQAEAFQGTAGRSYRWLLIADKIGETTIPDSNIVQKRGHQLPVTAVCLPHDADGSVFYSASKDCTITKWNGTTLTKHYTIKGHRKKTDHNGHTDQIFCLAVSSDGDLLASGGKDKLIKIWDTKDGKLLDTFKGHRDSISGLTFRQGTHELYSASHDRTVKIWNCDTRAYIETLYGHQEDVTSIHSFRRERCITCSGDKTVRLWKISEETQLVFRVPGKTGGLSLDCISLITEEYWVTGGQDGSIHFWNVQKKKPLFSIQAAHGFGEAALGSGAAPAPNWISAIAALPFSDLFASGSCDGTVKLWKVINSKTFVHVKDIPVKGWINSLTFSSHGNQLIVGVGQEHKLGRWTSIKEGKNGVTVITLREAPALAAPVDVPEKAKESTNGKATLESDGAKGKEHGVEEKGQSQEKGKVQEQGKKQVGKQTNQKKKQPVKV